MSHDKAIDTTDVKQYFTVSTPGIFRHHMHNLTYRCLAVFDNAVMNADTETMAVCCKDFRQIATKLDAYRRLKERALRDREKKSNGNDS